MKQSLILAIASCGAFALLAVSPASAATIERASQRVSYADLNLGNQAGAEIMLHRIRSAADAICGDRFGRMSLRRHERIRACSRAAMNKAVQDVGSPILAELFYDRYFDRRPSVTIAGL
jgi:UrcA family protein